MATPTPDNPLHEEKQKVGQHSTVDPDTSIDQDKEAVGDDLGKPLREGQPQGKHGQPGKWPHPAMKDNEPEEPDARTQHGEQSDARKGSQPGHTGHINVEGSDNLGQRDGNPRQDRQESGQSRFDE